VDVYINKSWSYDEAGGIVGPCRFNIGKQTGGFNGGNTAVAQK
jgi:hypothetical protein